MIIPLDLKNKLINMEGTLTCDMNSIEVTTLDSLNRSYIPGVVTNELQLTLNDPDSIVAVNDWFNTHVELDIGSYIGIRPIAFFRDMNSVRVTFFINKIDMNAGCWQDWFIQGDTNYELSVDLT